MLSTVLSSPCVLQFLKLYERNMLAAPSSPSNGTPPSTSSPFETVCQAGYSVNYWKLWVVMGGAESLGLASVFPCGLSLSN